MRSHHVAGRSGSDQKHAGMGSGLLYASKPLVCGEDGRRLLYPNFKSKDNADATCGCQKSKSDVVEVYRRLWAHSRAIGAYLQTVIWGDNLQGTVMRLPSVVAIVCLCCSLKLPTAPNGVAFLVMTLNLDPV